MPIYTRDEFINLTGQTTKTLSTYTIRKKVVITRGKDGNPDTVDSTNPVNAAFLAKYGSRAPKATPEPAKLPTIKKVGALPSINTKKTEGAPDSDNEEENEDGLMPLIKSEKMKQHFLALRNEKMNELAALEIQKKKGDVIPTGPIETLIFQFKQTTLTTGEKTYERFLGEISHKYSITPEDMAYYRGYFIKELNLSANEATDTFIMNLEVVLNEFSVKKRA